ncbi:MoeH5 [Corynebacterium xerosis]|nr:MoeH5 [Corynebacterium xerosis]
MNDFLIAVPRLGLLSADKAARENEAKTRLASVAATYQRYKAEGSAGTATVDFPASGSTGAVLTWPNGESHVQSRGDFWAVSTDQRTTMSLLHAMRLRGGALVYDSPAWGSYAATFGEKYSQRVWFWNTTPALEAIHFGADSEFVFVSNRPLLVALSLSHGLADVDLDRAYLPEYLHLGYSVSGRTSFKGVTTIPVNGCLVVHRGEIFFREVPRMISELSAEHGEEEGAEALAQALQSATRRSLEQANGATTQLRLSGGKDSRLLAGLLRQQGAGVEAITYGVEEDTEVQLSRRIAQMAGFPHTVSSPSLAVGVNLRERVERIMFECGGIPASEAHLGETVGSDPSLLGEPIMLGQWPLMKGGIAKVMRYPEGGIRGAVHKQASNILSSRTANPIVDMLNEWFDDAVAGTELEKLYLFAREFRSGRYLHSHVTHYSRDALVIYPISDMQVTAVCDVLTMAEKVSQRALFLATQRIWPEVMALPLHGSSWRFEAGGPADISGNTYGLRNAAQPIQQLPRQRTHAQVDQSTPGDSIQNLAIEIVSGGRWPYFRDLLSTEMSNAIESTATGQSAPPAGMSIRAYKKSVWRVLLADVWLSGGWLRDLRES